MGCSNSKTVENNENTNNSTSNTKSSRKKETGFNSHTNTLKLNSILNNDKLENNYKAIEKLGTGSFGKVYRVNHLKSGQDRALKVVNKAIIKYQDDEKTFLKEIELLSQLDHPSIIKVYEYFVENNNYYVVQEYCRGGELYEQIYKIDCFTEKSAAIIMKQLLSAVFYLHSVNIVHRDLKPENIMLENDEETDNFIIKLIDFGTANYFEQGKTLSQKVGTSLYIAPEVVLKKYNEKCDVWSCGVILYILLCGFPPYDGDTDEDIMESVVRDEVSYDEQEWENISPEAINFLKKLLHKDYKKRITAEEALQEPWLLKTAESTHSESELKNIHSQLQNFQKFDAKQKLKHSILAFMVHHLATEEMTKDLKDTFKRMDKSNDGRLSLQELIEGIRETLKNNNKGELFNEEDIIRRFKAIDTDASNYIEIEEFITVTISEELLLNEKNLKLTFDYFDKDKSGCLDVSEIESLLQSRGKEEDKAMVKELIAKYDTNKDGVLSFDEFKELIKEYNPNLKLS